MIGRPYRLRFCSRAGARLLLSVARARTWAIHSHKITLWTYPRYLAILSNWIHELLYVLALKTCGHATATLGGGVDANSSRCHDWDKYPIRPPRGGRLATGTESPNDNGGKPDSPIDAHWTRSFTNA